MAKANSNLSLLKNLKGYKEAKEKAANFTGEFDAVPNGRYDARITKSETTLSKGKEAMVVFGLVITGDSEEEGRKVNAFVMLEGAGAGLHVFTRLGYELPDDPADLKGIIEELGASEKDVQIEVKGGFATILGSLEGEPAIAGDEDGDVEDSESEEVEETEEDASEEVEEAIGVGDNVAFTWKGETLEGIIISEDGTTAKIKSGTKTYPVKLENIQGKVEQEEAVEEEEVEEEEVEEKPKKQPAPKKGTTVAKKVAAKPAAKKVAKKK